MIQRLLFGFLVLLMIACGKESDESDPVVSNFTVNSRIDTVIISSGANLTMQASVTDDMDLGQYQLSVSDSFASTYANVLSLLDIGNLEGTAGTINTVFNTTDSATAGIYVASLEVMDKQGNLTEASEVVVYVTNPNQPIISVSSPDFTSTVALNAGDTLWVQGQIVDAVDLQTATFDLGGLDTEEVSMTDTTLAVYDFSLLAASGQYLVVPAETDAGWYLLTIDAYNYQGHFTRWQGWVSVN